MNTIEKAIYNRTELLVGDDVMTALAKTRVIIFGVGGVGSWCAEGLVRSGITHLTIVDSDRICITNVNRQLMATTRTVGQVKVDTMKDRLLEINPKAEITAIQQIYSAETASQFNLDDYDYVVDAVDSLKDKVQLILNATASSAKFYCSLGAALKVNPLKVQNSKASLRINQGFSVTNLRYLKNWYLFYNQCFTNRYQLGNDLDNNSMPEILAYIPWRHHIDILREYQGMLQSLT